MTAPARPPRPRPGGPLTTPRPMPEMPVDGYAPYRLWGTAPPQDGWRPWLLDWLTWALGRDCRLLYIGITSRAGFVRWVEHSDDKPWARDVSYAERDDDIRWPTLHDAVLDEDGALVLVIDLSQDDGLRPARPGELVAPSPHVRQFRGREVSVYRPTADGQPVRGKIIEGALTGERRMIRDEAPIHNDQHNDNPHAVNRRRRIVPHHYDAWRNQAADLALLWATVSSLVVLVSGPNRLGWDAALHALSVGMPVGALLIVLGQIARHALRSRVNIILHRRRTRRRRTRR